MCIRDSRGTAPLRRVALRLRPSVPRTDGEARRRPHRRALAGDLDRAEDDGVESAIDGGDGDGDLRLSSPALRQYRHPALPELRPRNLVTVARAHPRHGD